EGVGETPAMQCNEMQCNETMQRNETARRIRPLPFWLRLAVGSHQMTLFLHQPTVALAKLGHYSEFIRGIGIAAVPSLPKAVRRGRLPNNALAVLPTDRNVVSSGYHERCARPGTGHNKSARLCAKPQPFKVS